MRLVLLIALLTAPSIAVAYVGPGMGLGALAVILGGIVSVVVAIFAVIYYPLKIALRKWRAKAGKK